MGTAYERRRRDEDTIRGNEQVPDPYTEPQTPTRTLTSIRQAAVAGPSTENGTESSKRQRIDEPVTRPRLGDSGFSIEQYVSYYSDDRLDSYHFPYLRQG